MTSSADNRLRVWDPRSGQLLAESPVLPSTPTFLQRYKGSVVGLSRSRSEIVVWDYTTGADPVRYPFPNLDGTSDLAVDEATGELRIASDKEVWFFRLPDGTPAGQLPRNPVGSPTSTPARPAPGWPPQARTAACWCGPPVRPAAARYSPPTSSSETEVPSRRWSSCVTARSSRRAPTAGCGSGTSRTPPRLTGHTDWVRDIDLSRDGRWLATASADGYGHVVSTADITTSVGRFGSGTALSAVQIDPSDPHRVFALEPGHPFPPAWRWNENGPSEGPVWFDQPPHQPDQYLVSIDVSPDGTTLAAGDTAGNVYMWDTRNGRLLPDRQLAGAGYPAWSLALNPTGHQLATTAQEGVRLIDTATGAERLLDHPNTTGVDFDAAGDRLVSVATVARFGSGTVTAPDTGSRRAHEPAGPGVVQPGWRARGGRFRRRARRGWDVGSGTTLTLTRQHGDSVNDVLFAPGSRYRLLTASDDTTMTAWDCSACDDPEGAIKAAEASLGA